MSKLAELQAETREIIADLLNDGSDPDALYIIEHHIAHHDFDLLEKIAVDAFKAGYEVSEAEEFKDDDGKNKYVHMLNGTAIAVSRALVAIIENYQQKDGSIKIPDALVPYCGFDVIKKK